MLLPEIVQNQDYKQELYELIKSRYSMDEEGKFNFESGELSIIKNISFQSNEEIQKLLKTFLSMKIQNGYCYFKLRQLLGLKHQKIKQKIVEQNNLLIDKKSDYHKINHLILMRQILIGKLQNKFEISQEIQGFIDDIRFINQQIIRSIRLWRNNIQQNIEKQTIIYLYKRENYLTKMITDNDKIISNFNSKHQIFNGIPNPFFIFKNSKNQTLSVKNINQYLQYLSEEKAIQLKMIIQSPYVKAIKGFHVQRQLSQLRNTIEDQKVEKIKTIYQQDLRSSKTTTFVKLQEDKIDLMTMKNQFSIKNLDKLIKIKEIQVLKEINKKKLSLHSQKLEQTSSLKQAKNSYLSKIQLLKAEVEKNTKIGQKKQKIPKAQAEIKASKPKMRIISEKNTSVQTGIKKQLKNDEISSKLSKSRSTFYKPKNQTKQIKQQSQRQVRKQENLKMISSAYSSSLSKLSNRRSSTNIRFNVRRSASRKGEKQRSRSKQQIDEIKDSLSALNKRIRQQAIKNIYTNKSIKLDANSKSGIRYKQKQLNEVSNVEQMNKSKTIFSSFEDKIKQKQNYIDTLKMKLLQLKQKNNEELNKLQNSQQNKKLIDLKKQQNQKQKIRLELENIRMKQQMKKQQLKFLALKEKQYQLRQAQLQKKYKFQLEKIKEDLELKNKQWQLKIIQQKKKHKQSQQKIQQIRKKSQAVAFELKQRQIKESLIVEIQHQQQLKKKKDLQKNQQKKADLLIQIIKKQQQMYKIQLQKRSTEMHQKQKLKLNQLYLQMKKKNEALQDQNKKRHLELQKVEAQKNKQLQALRNLQTQLIQKQKQLDLQKFLNNSNVSNVSIDSPKKKIKDQQLADLQQLKQRIKQQIVEEIKRKRKAEQKQQKQYEQQRKKQMQQMQQQLRKVIKLEQEELLKIQEQYKLKNEQILRNHQQQIIQSRLKKSKLAQEAEQNLKRLAHSQPFQTEKLVTIQTGLQGNKIQRAISSLQVYQLQKQQSQFFVKEKQKQQIKAQISSQLVRQQKKQQKKQQILSVQLLNNSKVSENIQNSQKIIIQEIKQKAPQQIQSKIESPEKATQSIKQNSQQIKQKYDLLLQKVSKPVKQIYMAYDQIDSYLTKFYNQLSPQVKQMMPYSRKEIQSIFRQKKIDIFDGFNFGLYRPKDLKFTLFGTIDCIPLIASKYGQIQVQQIYIFNKANGYQKSYLSKLIKIYEKIGYIYQKKTNQQGIHTIKFIIKIPKEIKKEIKLKDQLQLNTIIRFQQHNNFDIQLIKNNCLYYLLGRGLSNILGQNQLNQIAKQNDIESKYIMKKINETNFNSTLVKTQLINHNIAQLTISLPIKYIQTSDQPYFTIQVIQYVIQTTGQKIYLALYQESNIALVIHQMNDTDIPEGFSLQTYIESKFKKMEKLSDMFVFFPIWQSFQKYSYKGRSPKSFTYTQKTHANLVYGSIVKSKVKKGDFIFLQPPFAFLIFEISSAEVLKRMIFGQIVKPEQVLKFKRVIN